MSAILRIACVCAAFASLLASNAVRAQAPTPSPTPVAAVPNATSLRALAGKYPAGRSRITIETAPTYGGGARLSATAPTEISLDLRITARVATPAGLASIDNRLTFSADGTMRGRNLAPGVARRAPFAGTYTAAGRRISFLGAYKFGAAAGTFTGAVQRNAKGRLFVAYSIFASGMTGRIYTYRYSAISRRK